MTLKNYSFGVAVLALGAACGGTILDGSNQSSNDAGKEPHPDTGTPVAEAGAPAMEAGAPEAAPDTGPVDSGPDHGEVSMTYPAFKPYMPQVVANGGAVLGAPQFVTITWTSDSSFPTWEAFDDTIGATSYWKTATSEYGVGPAVGGPTNHVEQSSAPPVGWSDTDVANFVQTNAGDTATSGWPAPTSNSLYVVWLPPSTASGFTLGGFGNACNSGVGGYHDNVNVSGIGDVAYAVVIPCGYLPATALGSHELAEAATDPHPSGLPAYTGIDDSQYFAWDAFQAGSGTEIGDMCETYCDAFFTDDKVDTTLPAGGDTVQRMWSNASAAAGHAPCVPASATSYYNVTPLSLESVTINASALGGSSVMGTQGYKIPVGGSKTFAIGFYSDGPSAAWNITASDLGDPFDGYYFNASTKSRVSVSVDKTSGQNGQVAYVTVQVNAMDQTNSDIVLIRSELPGTNCSFGYHHDMPILISSN